jgi:hypothetical protein
VLLKAALAPLTDEANATPSDGIHKSQCHASVMSGEMMGQPQCFCFVKNLAGNNVCLMCLPFFTPE